MKSMDTTTEDMNTISSANDEPSNDNNVGVNYGQISKRQLKDIREKQGKGTFKKL